MAPSSNAGRPFRHRTNLFFPALVYSSFYKIGPEGVVLLCPNAVSYSCKMLVSCTPVLWRTKPTRFRGLATITSTSRRVRRRWFKLRRCRFVAAMSGYTTLISYLRCTSYIAQRPRIMTASPVREAASTATACVDIPLVMHRGLPPRLPTAGTRSRRRESCGEKNRIRKGLTFPPWRL